GRTEVAHLELRAEIERGASHRRAREPGEAPPRLRPSRWSDAGCSILPGLALHQQQLDAPPGLLLSDQARGKDARVVEDEQVAPVEVVLEVLEARMLLAVFAAAGPDRCLFCSR